MFLLGQSNCITIVRNAPPRRPYRWPLRVRLFFHISHVSETSRVFDMGRSKFIIYLSSSSAVSMRHPLQFAVTAVDRKKHPHTSFRYFIWVDVCLFLLQLQSFGATQKHASHTCGTPIIIEYDHICGNAHVSIASISYSACTHWTCNTHTHTHCTMLNLIRLSNRMRHGGFLAHLLDCCNVLDPPVVIFMLMAMMIWGFSMTGRNG